ncbi:MAG: M67 family metallopeptidase [Synergistaceae bacterium]|jgi:proteasome lid subunit RPN8/RPN11|nr:M67 family metallopeptidase [Synergistaceae bacterium]
MITLPDDVKLAINAEGEWFYPDECCGVLFGGVDREGNRTVTEILPISNARETEERRRRFVIEADDFMRAESEARGKGLDVLGFYHSHPDHPAEPSAYDLEHALPFYSYAIVSVKGGTASELTVWELEGDRSKFVPIPQAG